MLPANETCMSCAFHSCSCHSDLLINSWARPEMQTCHLRCTDCQVYSHRIICPQLQCLVAQLVKRKPFWQTMDANYLDIPKRTNVLGNPKSTCLATKRVNVLGGPKSPNVAATSWGCLSCTRSERRGVSATKSRHGTITVLRSNTSVLSIAHDSTSVANICGDDVMRCTSTCSCTFFPQQHYAWAIQITTRIMSNSYIQYS